MSGQTDVATASTASAGIRLTFAQGFLVGQLSVVLIALIAIRYIIFEDSRYPSKSHSRQARSNPPGEPFRKSRRVASDKGGYPRMAADVAHVMADLMSKVRYDVESHSGESLDWFNVVFAQAVAGYRDDIEAGGWSAQQRYEEVQRTAKEWMEQILNAGTVGRGMTFLDPIQVTEVSFGDAYPILTNARIRPADETGRMRVEVDVDYTDRISLSINTKLVVNLPRPRFAVLPISLGLTVERFSGTLAIELYSNNGTTIVPPSDLPSPPRSRHELHFSLHPDFALDATASSLIGSRAKLQDIPKIEQLLVDRIRNYIHDRFVWPKYWSSTLPNLVPRLDFEENVVAEGGNGVMHVVGNGDVSHDIAQRNEGKDNRDDDVYPKSSPSFSYEARPPTGLAARRPEPPPSLPGSLPAVEAWRTQSAATGVQSRSVNDARASSAAPRWRGDPQLRRESSVGGALA